MKTSFAAYAGRTPKAIRPNAKSIAPTGIDRVPCIGRLLSKQTVETKTGSGPQRDCAAPLIGRRQLTAASSTREAGPPTRVSGSGLRFAHEQSALGDAGEAALVDDLD